MTHEMIWLAATSILAATTAPTPPAESLEQGLAALEIGYRTMALPELEKALRILSAQATGADPSGALHHHVARAHEAMALYHANHGAAADAVRHLERGIQAAKEAIDRTGDVSAYHATLGDLYGELAAQSGVVGKMRYGRLAAASFAKALALDPKNPRAHLGAGIAKLETPGVFGGSVAAAIAEFRSAQSLDAGCAEAWIWEGIAHRRLGSIAEARRAFAKALEVSPGNDHAQRELATLEEEP